MNKGHFTTHYFTMCDFANDEKIVMDLKAEPDFFNRNLILAHIPKKYWKYEWNDISSDLGMNDCNNDGIIATQEYLDNLNDMYTSGHGLYIYGGHGTSKTTTATIILREAMIQNFTGYYLHFHELIEFISVVWKDERKKAYWEYITQNIDFLVLDDIARNFKMSDKESFVIDRLFVYRSNNNLPTILTTNLSKGDIGTLLGESILSLFKENVSEVKFVGEDVRGKCQSHSAINKSKK